MKNIINITLTSLCLFSIIACDRNPIECGKGMKPVASLYVDGEATNKAHMYKPQEITVQDENQTEVEKLLSVGVSYIGEKDMVLNLEVSNKDAITYMDRTKTRYEILPSSLIEIPQNIVVKKGETKSVSIPFKVKIDNTVKFNVPYIFAIKLNGDVDYKTCTTSGVVEANRVALYTLVRNVAGEVKINKALHLYRTNYLQLAKRFPYDLPEGMTIECLVNAQQFRSVSDEGEAQISTLCGIEGDCLFRFGDAGVPGNYLQCVGTKLDFAFETNKWYHIAATISADGNMKVYVNGKELMNVNGKYPSLASPEWYIGKSYSDGRGINALFSEFRVWNKVRTQSQIQDNMYNIDPTTEGLLAYWKMDKSNGNTNIVEDATGKGYDLILSTQTQTADTPDKQGRPADRYIVIDELKKPISID